MRTLCIAKDSHILSTKNNSVFVTLADICLTNLCLNDIVKLTMLWTTGSRWLPCWESIFLFMPVVKRFCDVLCCVFSTYLYIPSKVKIKGWLFYNACRQKIKTAAILRDLADNLLSNLLKKTSDLPVKCLLYHIPSRMMSCQIYQTTSSFRLWLICEI